MRDRELQSNEPPGLLYLLLRMFLQNDGCFVCHREQYRDHQSNMIKEDQMLIHSHELHNHVVASDARSEPIPE